MLTLWTYRVCRVWVVLAREVWFAARKAQGAALRVACCTLRIGALGYVVARAVYLVRYFLVVGS